MSQTVACPSCGAPIAFRSSASVFAVCASCGSTVVRGGQDVERIGVMADLPDEMTPFQVGTTITFRGRGYTLAGRVRVGWADGAWNEWYLAGDDGAAWLAEAQGFLAVSMPMPLEQARGLDLASLPGLDATMILQGRMFRVTDIKQATCIGSEGELPFRAPRGRAATYFDMLDEAGGFASLEASAEGRQLYVGAYVTFDDLHARGLRDVEGWPAPAAPPGEGDPAAPPP